MSLMSTIANLTPVLMVESVMIWSMSLNVHVPTELWVSFVRSMWMNVLKVLVIMVVLVLIKLVLTNVNVLRDS